MNLSEISKESLKSSKSDKATIMVEKINGPILLISGDEDEFWPSDTFCENIIKRLENCNFKYKKEHYCYSRSGHFMNIPYQGLRGNQNNVLASVQANRDSWDKTLNFFYNNLF